MGDSREPWFIEAYQAGVSLEENVLISDQLLITAKSFLTQEKNFNQEPVKLEIRAQMGRLFEVSLENRREV